MKPVTDDLRSLWAYRVDLVVSDGVRERFAAWLPGHVERVVAAGGFGSAWWQVADSGAVRVEYRAGSRGAIEQYLDGAGIGMRAETKAAFPAGVTVLGRSIMDPVDAHPDKSAGPGREQAG